MRLFSSFSRKQHTRAASLLMTLALLPLSMNASYDPASAESDISIHETYVNPAQAAHSDQPADVDHGPERITLGSKKAPKKSKTRSQRAQKQSKKKNHKAIQKCFNVSPRYTPSYLVKSVGASGKTLSMNDETIWEISGRSASTAATWPQNSQIIIRPNRSWFSSYDYRLYNLSTGESVEADLSQGPFVKYTVLITNIDRYYGFITLSDNSIWAINRSDSLSKLQQWQEGQAVLFGENSSWFGLPHILININENEYLPVSCTRVF